MKSRQEVSAFANAEPDSIKKSSVDRRQFMGYAAGLGAWMRFRGSVFAQGQATDAGKRLPDGTEQVSWEVPLTFSRTYHVDNGSARADDDGPGSNDRPFRTIGKAAQVLQPGERVVIASGTYREWVRPERGGDGADKMISYEAAPGAKVYIKGSEVLKEGWTQDPVNVFRRRRALQAALLLLLRRLPPGDTSLPARCSPMPTTLSRWRAWPATAHGWIPKRLTWGLTSGGAGWSLRMANPWSRWKCSENWEVQSCSHRRPRARRSLPTVCPRELAAVRSCRRSEVRGMGGSGPTPTANRSTSASPTALLPNI